MQKQKIEPLYLILHSDYENVFCGLFRGNTPLATAQEHKIKASKNLMQLLVDLLASHNVTWNQLDFIGVNQGPSPFTTLRVVITTVNGLLFSHNIPLVGVDGLHTFLTEYHQQKGLVVALLNAFNNDVYYGITYPDQTVETGWEFNGTFLQRMHTKYGNLPITFIGNGAAMYKERLENLFAHARIPEPIQQTASLEAISFTAFLQWEKGLATQEPLLPLYLKTLTYKEST